MKQLKMKQNNKNILREKCPYSEFLWSVFSFIPTEYRDLFSKSPYSVQMRENTNHKNFEYGQFLHSEVDFQACNNMAAMDISNHFLGRVLPGKRLVKGGDGFIRAG